jgi:hypothetical protein
MVIAHLSKVRRCGSDHIELIAKCPVRKVKKYYLVIGVVKDIVDSRTAGIDNEIDGKQVLALLQPLPVVNAPLAIVIDFLNDVTKQHGSSRNIDQAPTDLCKHHRTLEKRCAELYSRRSAHYQTRAPTFDQPSAAQTCPLDQP